ncbi:hypothetical protein K440DRAFT_642955 [Wilcoxina mikolae CBS 423.85]|nr:hypothetical protein K440DRAFT_642955 [Wilcoxina mikolae CBS 423.85]
MATYTLPDGTLVVFLYDDQDCRGISAEYHLRVLYDFVVAWNTNQRDVTGKYPSISAFQAFPAKTVVVRFVPFAQPSSSQTYDTFMVARVITGQTTRPESPFISQPIFAATKAGMLNPGVQTHASTYTASPNVSKTVSIHTGSKTAIVTTSRVPPSPTGSIGLY